MKSRTSKNGKQVIYITACFLNHYSLVSPMYHGDLIPAYCTNTVYFHNCICICLKLEQVFLRINTIAFKVDNTYQEFVSKMRERDKKDTHNNLNVYFDYKTNINSIKLINKYTNI